MTSPIPPSTTQETPSSSTHRTPLKNNYADSQSPIASAKRPRQPGSKSQTRYRGSYGTSTNVKCATTPVSNGRLRTYEENQHDRTPTQGLDIPINYNDVKSFPSEMSPMHPPKPVPVGVHGKEREESEVPPSTSTPITLQRQTDIEASDVTNGVSWVGRKVDAIFSPVLSFLNSKNPDNQESHDSNDCFAIDHDGDISMENNQGYHDKSYNNINDLQIKNSIQDAKNVQSDNYDLDSFDGASENSAQAVVIRAEDTSDLHMNNMGAYDVNYVHSKNVSSGRVKEDQVHSDDSMDTIDDSVDDDGVDDEEDEFNPYLFMKTLPPYNSVVTAPYSRICLPPKQGNDPKITLVLDLDETLVHCTVEPTHDADLIFPVVFNGIEYSVNVRLRPYLMEFLEAIRSKFEVVIFTASQEVYANELLNRIDPEGKYIKHRMFRDSCLLVEGNYLKDLNVLGRDLSTSVLVDNSPHAFGYQVDNGIPIESWFDDQSDTELLKLEQFLGTLHGVDDVRTVVRNKFQTYQLIRNA